MKLPWDKNCFKICFYAVLSAASFYILKLLIDAISFAIKDIDKVTKGVGFLLSDLLSLLAPLITACVIAYLLDPVVNFYEKNTKKIKFKNRKIHNFYKKRILGGNRTFPTFLAYITVSAIIWFFIMAGLLGVKKSDSFTGSVSNSINNISSEINDMLIAIQLKLVEWNLSEHFEKFYEKILFAMNEFFINLSADILARLSSLGGVIMNLAVGIVVAFYILVRKEELFNRTNDFGKTLLNGKIYKTIVDVLRDFHKVLSGYVRGQLTDGLIMVVLISAGLTAIGVDFAIIIGILTGFSNLIPYFGAVIGFVLSVVMGFVTGPPIKALYAGIYLLVIQQIDAVVIVPKVVGDKVKLSPPAVMLAVIIGGKIFGMFGMILSVPVCALTKIWFGRFYDNYKFKKSGNLNE